MNYFLVLSEINKYFQSVSSLDTKLMASAYACENQCYDSILRILSEEIIPDDDEAQTLNLGTKELADVMEQNRQELNTMIPAYSKVSEIRIHEDEFDSVSDSCRSDAI